MIPLKTNNYYHMKINRLHSLDAFRGFTIAAMILVNFPGNWDHVYSPLSHSEWFGISFTDLVAPFFLFVVGVSIALAYTKRIEVGVEPKLIYRKLFSRAVKIFAVGMFLNILAILPELEASEIRWTGTLHRIAIVFLVCGVLFLKFSWKGQAIIGGTILIVYWIVMTMIPTPGYEKAMLEPGINMAAWIDNKFLPGKLWQGNWDPEGILSTFPAIVSGISGMLVGKIIVSDRTWERKIIQMFIWGFGAFVAGIAWNWNFPLNENIWTSSFVLVTSGMASMTLAACVYLVDILHYRKWAEFGIIYGMNAITVYVLADIFAFIFYGLNFKGASLNEHFFDFFTSMGVAAKFASMTYGILYVLINFIPAYLLFRKRIFIKL